MRSKLLFLWILLTVAPLMAGSSLRAAQDDSVYSPVGVLKGKCSMREVYRMKKTYPATDPDPVPDIDRKCYPYFRHNGYTNDPIQKEWKIVEMENDLIYLAIYPEIGGKVWSAIDKKSGQEFFYDNPVVKFRDIAMRGPWTSGGLEMNIGVVGHTPSTAVPVDYKLVENEDGSMSCFYGSNDLLGRARWSVEIRLCPDTAAFTTTVRVDRFTANILPCYSWFCLGIPIGDELEGVFPGTHWIWHDATPGLWKIDEQGRDVSWYKNNTFGTYKSYHVFGRPTETFGSYYHDEDWGVSAYVEMEAKIGRKFWIWGVSREGMIWERLLTDEPKPHYVEIQTGRFFTQAEGTVDTPFKELPSTPYRSEAWTETWMPVRGIDGMTSTGRLGTANFRPVEGGMKLGIFPVVSMSTDLELWDGETLLSTQNVDLSAGDPKEFFFPMTTIPEKLEARFGGDLLIAPLEYEADSRPSESADSGGRGRLSDHYYLALQYMAGREILPAYEEFQKALEKDPSFVPAIVGLAEVEMIRGRWQEAFDHALHALEFDTCHPMANLQLAMAGLHLHKLADSLQGFAIATMDDQTRYAGQIGMGQAYLAKRRYHDALNAFDVAARYGDNGAMALWGKSVASRLLGEMDQARSFTALGLERNPVDQILRLESYLAGGMTKEELFAGLNGEWPYQSFLEMAPIYEECGRVDDAIALLKTALEMPGIERSEILYTLAYYAKDPSYIQAAQKESIDFVLPFRGETRSVFDWAKEQVESNPALAENSWKTVYLRAVLLMYLGDREEGLNDLQALGDTPNEPTFYAFRGMRTKNQADFRKAHDMNPDVQRYAVLFLESLDNENDKDECMVVAKEFLQKFPQYARTLTLYINALIRNQRYQEAYDFLKNAVFIPTEGGRQARRLYVGLAQRLMNDALVQGDYERALQLSDEAMLWPEHLGSGKPYYDDSYGDDINERPEDWVAYTCLMKLGRSEEAQKRLLQSRVFAEDEPVRLDGYDALYEALILRAAGREEEAKERIAFYDGKEKAEGRTGIAAKFARRYFEDPNFVPEIDPNTTDMFLKVFWATRAVNQ